MRHVAKGDCAAYRRQQTSFLTDYIAEQRPCNGTTVPLEEAALYAATNRRLVSSGRGEDVLRELFGEVTFEKSSGTLGRAIGRL
ncbi:MAG: hypothetical protein ACREX3_06790, partial [Gammaproteobacteria bacterium]